MLSIPDIAIIGTVALLIFGPDQLPKVMRKTGQVVREIQNTSQSFIREMERAADAHETEAAAAAYEASAPPVYDEIVPPEPLPEHESAVAIDADAADVAPPPPAPDSVERAESGEPAGPEIPRSEVTPVDSRAGQPAP